jgi:transcriptional regulator with XRE-family HTH domain
MTIMADTPELGGETVEVKKRRLRAAVRKYRAEAKLTQKQVADELGWSISKIVRIEAGQVPISPSDVRAMLHFYREEDAAREDQLVELAKEVREKKGFAEYKDILSQASQDLFGLEGTARVIYQFEPSVVPGLFQTYDYGRELLRALGQSERDVERRLAVRQERQLILEQVAHPELNIVLGEAALSRRVGDADVMLEQLKLLEDQSQADGINLWVLPFAAGPHRGMGTSAFTILQFDDPQLEDLLYLESADNESTSRDEAGQIKLYLDLFVDLQKMAADAGSFVEHLDKIRGERFGVHKDEE